MQALQLERSEKEVIPMTTLSGSSNCRWRDRAISHEIDNTTEAELQVLTAKLADDWLR